MRNNYDPKRGDESMDANELIGRAHDRLLLFRRLLWDNAEANACGQMNPRDQMTLADYLAEIAFDLEDARAEVQAKDDAEYAREHPDCPLVKRARAASERRDATN